MVRPEERRRILALARDLPAIWEAPSTCQTDRKQLLGYLIKDVTICRGETAIRVAIRWQTEACTEMEVPRPRRSYEVRRTDPAIVERVRALAPERTDSQTAALLNQEGLRSGTGGSFTADKVQWIRYAHTIPSGCPEGPAACPDGYRGDGRCTAQVAAAQLNVNVSTVAAWCRSGRLDGIQAVPHGPRWILLTPEIVAELRQPVQRRWSRRSGI